MAKREIEAGLSAVCAWCEHWHNGKDQWTVTKCGQMECGGPGANPAMAFPKYKGPWQNNLIKLCFICGEEPDAAVEIHGKGFLGVCKKHIVPLKRMLDRPGGKPRTGPLPVVKEKFVPVPKEGDESA